MSGARPIIDVEGCSKYYGHVLGCADITWKVSGGIIGLLGPNGAGKSTLMKMLVGLLRPSRGKVEVYGALPFASAETRARIGYCPEHENMYDELTGLELVTAMAALAGVPRRQARDAAARALDAMGMKSAQDRRIKGYSKGMRQRTKLATALAHDPELLLLDEPLTGVDPMARIDIIERIRVLASAGKTIVISSHVLYEIEALTSEIVVVYRGQVLAEGNVYEIRQLIDEHPHRIRVECDRPRVLAAALAGADHVVKLVFESERSALTVETANPDRCYDEIAAAVAEQGLAVANMTSPDNNLGAVFEYLTGGGRGR
jgi:ABC-2 type transport system ATP-binding protein